MSTARSYSIYILRTNHTYNTYHNLIFLYSGSGDASQMAKFTSTDTETESAGRRWSSVQSREFGPIHSVITNLVLHSDLSSMWTGRSFS